MINYRTLHTVHSDASSNNFYSYRNNGAYNKRMILRLPAVVFFLLVFSIVLINFPLEASVIEETGSLRGFLAGHCETAAYDNWISHCSEGLADEGYNHYGPPGLDDQTIGFGSYTQLENLTFSNEVIEQWHYMLDLLLQGDIYTIGDILEDSLDVYHYEAVIFHDTEINRDYYILREQLDLSFIDDGGTEDNPDDDVVGSFRNGWGIYIVDPNSPRPYLNIQTPHPGDDFLGVQCVVEMFLRLDAGSMNIAGAGREVLWDQGGAYSNSRSLSDPSRHGPSVFQAFVEELREDYQHDYPPGLMIFQIHSYDVTHDNKNPVIISGGQYHTFIHKPLFDRIDHEHDVINLTDAVPVPENLLGTHPAVSVEDYYWLNYSTDFPFYYYYNDEDRVQIPRATSLRCDPNSIQENYLHDENYLDGSLFENFFHVEFCEFPDVLEDAGLGWDDLYGPERPQVFETFAPIFQFYEPCFQAIDEWFIMLENLEDDVPPSAVENLECTPVDDTSIYLSWDGAEDANFLSYEVLIDTPTVSIESNSIWGYKNDFNLVVMGEETSTLVTNLPDGVQWQIAVCAVDLNGNRGPISNVVTAMTVDDIGIELNSCTFEEFPLTCWPAWSNAQIDDYNDLDSIYVEWYSSADHHGTTSLESIGQPWIFGAEFPIPAEELAVDDTVYWRVHCSDISFTGNPRTIPEEGYYTIALTDNEPQHYTSSFEEDNGLLESSGQWEWGSPEYGPSEAHSGSNLWGMNLDGHYSPNTNSQLVLHDVNLSGYAPLQLAWWQWYDFENRRDGGTVKFIYNGQEYDLEPLGGYPGSIASQSNPLNGNQAFTGSVNHWHPVAIDLKALFGLNNVDIVFSAGTDLGGQYAGWYLDDFSIVPIVNHNPPLACELVFPENGIELPDLESDFSWDRSQDIDLYTEPPTYELVFNLNDDTITIFTGLDTTSYVHLDSLHLRAYEPSQVLWWVNSISQGDRTQSEIRIINTPAFNEVEQNTQELPSEYSIKSVWPNPFNPVVNVSYEVPERSMVKLEILNILGQRVALLEQDVKTAGSFNLSWNAYNQASSIYFVRMEAPNFNAIKKVVLLK